MAEMQLWVLFGGIVIACAASYAAGIVQGKIDERRRWLEMFRRGRFDDGE